MNKLNNIEIVTNLPSDVKFQPHESPILCEGRLYQLYIGERRISFSEQIGSLLKAGFTGLSPWSKKGFHRNRIVRCYVEVTSPSKEESLTEKAASNQNFQQVAIKVDNQFKVEAGVHPNLKEQQEKDQTSVSLAQKQSVEEEAEPIEKVKPTKGIQRENTLEEVLESIQRDAQRDLFLDEQYIEKKYGIQSRLASLPEEDQRIYQAKLNHMMNTAYLQQVLQDKGKIVVGEYLESTLLNCLDYSVNLDESPYQDKEAIYSAFKAMTQTQLKPEHFAGPHIAFRKLLHEYALKTRLQAAKMTDELQITKFKIALSLVQERAKKLEETAASIPMTWPLSFPLQSAPSCVKWLEGQFESMKSDEVINTIEKIPNEKLKNDFLNSNFNANSFENDLKELILLTEEQADVFLKEACEEDKKYLAKEVDFYNKWGTFIKAEMMQGYPNLNEVLGDGVCYAVCLRLLEEWQLKPDQEINGKLILNAVDRFRQALYTIKIRSSFTNTRKVQRELLRKLEMKNCTLLDTVKALLVIIKDWYYFKVDGKATPEWLKKSSLQKRQQLLKESDLAKTDFDRFLKSPKTMKKLEQSNGWMSISLREGEAGHEILLRLDQNRQKAWLFDPNVGVLCFENSGKTFDQARNECLQCLRDLLVDKYPNRYSKIAFYHQIPKERLNDY